MQVPAIENRSSWGRFRALVTVWKIGRLAENEDESAERFVLRAERSFAPQGAPATTTSQPTGADGHTAMLVIEAARLTRVMACAVKPILLAKSAVISQSLLAPDGALKPCSFDAPGYSRISTRLAGSWR